MPDEEAKKKYAGTNIIVNYFKTIGNKEITHSTLIQIASEKYNIGTDTVQFALTKQGLEIGKNYKMTVQESNKSEPKEINWYTKLCTHNQVLPNNSKTVYWRDQQYIGFSDPKQTIFTLEPVNEEANMFFIQMNYGEYNPRLTSATKSPLTYSSLICSTKQNGVHDEETQ